MCKFRPSCFGIGTNFLTLRTVDQVFSTVLTIVISLRNSNLLIRMR